MKKLYVLIYFNISGGGIFAFFSIFAPKCFFTSKKIAKHKNLYLINNREK